MKKLIIGLALVMCLLLPVSCASPASMPAPAPPILTNSESDSRVAELEAKIRQLESDNQRLLEENRQLSSDLVEITSVLESVQSEIPDILIMVTEIQNDSSDFAALLESLPDLPTPPPGLDDISKINDAIDKALFLRGILERLPAPPPFAPPEWYALDKMKDELIEMTKWMKDLEQVPEFLNIAGDLDDLRYQEIAHLQNINAAMDDIKSILEEIRDASWR
ncbi:hypothetical protein ES708_01419 [subsurface metagenome]